VCLAGLFFLARNKNHGLSALGEGILMVALVVVTGLSHIFLFSGFSPVMDYLPLSMVHEISEIQGVNDIKSPVSRPSVLNRNVSSDLKLGGDDNGITELEKSVENDEIVPISAPSSPNVWNGQVRNEVTANGNEGLTHRRQNTLDRHAFDHPASYEHQPIVWIPKDTLGLSEIELAGNREAGVDTSDLGATMNEKGKVDITRPPPDEEWESDEPPKTPTL